MTRPPVPPGAGHPLRKMADPMIGRFLESLRLGDVVMLLAASPAGRCGCSWCTSPR